MNLSCIKDVYCANGLAAKGKWILRPGWNHSAQECGCQIVQLVRYRQGTSCGCSRQYISGKSRHILFKNSIGNGLLLSIQHSILSSHFPLKFGKFLYQFSGQIRLGQESGSPGICLFLIGKSPVFCQSAGQLHQAVGLIQHVAHAFLIIDAYQIGPMFFQRFLAVIVEEEFGVIQTGTKNTFIPHSDVVESLCSPVSYGQEIRKQASIFFVQRIIALMITHRGNYGRYRKLKEFFINLSIQCGWIFDDEINFFEKSRVVPEFASQFVR